jgi:hypothetical protein
LAATIAIQERKNGRWHRLVYLISLLFLLAIACVAWMTDFVTLKGEWTIYTAACEHGDWLGPTCTGSLVASKRYRFRALKAHGEVFFWTAGERSASGRYVDCDIRDGRDWTCPPNSDAVRTITHEMDRGFPKPDPTVPTLGFHQIPKWKWEALRVGIPVGNRAMN